jgi:hypothetical protein
MNWINVSVSLKLIKVNFFERQWQAGGDKSQIKSTRKAKIIK